MSQFPDCKWCNSVGQHTLAGGCIKATEAAAQANTTPAALKLKTLLLTDKAVAQQLMHMAQVEDAWMNTERSLLLREAAKRIRDMRQTLDDVRSIADQIKVSDELSAAVDRIEDELS